MGKAITEAAEWLSKEPATDWGEHEWRLFNVVEEAETLQAKNARLREALNGLDNLTARDAAIVSAALRDTGKEGE